MLILGIDTSTSAISVGLSDGDGNTASAARIDSRGHAEHLAPLIDELLRSEGHVPGDLTDVVVGNGPGPYTGLRVGIVTGLTMGHALDIPVHGICSLDALANQVGEDVSGEFVVATDARRKEVYWARYAVSFGWAERLTGPAVDRPTDLPDEVRTLPVAGRGPLLHPESFPHPVDVLDVDAAMLCLLARARIRDAVEMPVEPLYLRRPDALTTAERGQA